MDLNHLYLQYQISSMQAASTCDGPKRMSLQNAADGFAAQIEQFQLRAGARAAASWRMGTVA